MFDSGAGAGTEPADASATQTATDITTPTNTPPPTAAPGTVPAAPESSPVTTIAPAAVAPTPSTEPEIVTVAAGSFMSRTHPGAGVATVLTDGSSQRFLRFENFSTDNGPDLNVYLTVAGADAPEGEFDDDFVDLGNLKGNIGDQNYEIPPEVDLERYDTVVVWCVRFGVAFTTADLVASLTSGHIGRTPCGVSAGTQLVRPAISDHVRKGLRDPFSGRRGRRRPHVGTAQ